jgi:hypothetical protein
MPLMEAHPSVVTRRLEIVDDEGRPRLHMSAQSGVPVLRLLQSDGSTGADVTLFNGYPSVRLCNPDPNGPTAVLELDDKGAHIKFDCPRGASSYLFLNNAGGSGVVLIDRNGVRRRQRHDRR